MPTSTWRNVCAAQSPTLFCVNSCQLSAFIHKFRCCFFGVFFVLFCCCCFFFFFSFSCFLFSLFFSCLLFATSLCLPGYRLLSDGDSKSKHWFTTSFPWRKMPKSDARSVGDSLWLSCSDGVSLIAGIAGSLVVGRLVLGSLALETWVPGIGGSLVLEIWVFPCCPTLSCGSHTETASQTHSRSLAPSSKWRMS